MARRGDGRIREILAKDDGDEDDVEEAQQRGKGSVVLTPRGARRPGSALQVARVAGLRERRLLDKVERRPQGQHRAALPVLRPRGARRPGAALRSAHAAGLRELHVQDEAADCREEPQEESSPPSPAASLLSVGSSVIADLSAPRGGMTTAAPVTPLPHNYGPEATSDDEFQHVTSAGSSPATSPRPGNRETVRRRAVPHTKVAAGQRLDTKGLGSHREVSRRPLASAARSTVVAATVAAAASVRAVGEPAKPVNKRRLAACAVDALQKLARPARPARPARARAARPAETPAVRSVEVGAAETQVRQKKRRKTQSVVETEVAAVEDVTITEVQGVVGESSATPPSGPEHSRKMQGRAPAAQAAAARGSMATTTPEVAENDLNEEEMRELKTVVLARLKETINGDVGDVTDLAELICILVEQNETREKMTKSLAFFHGQAEPFIIWVEERKAQLLARRRALAAFAKSRAAPAAGTEPSKAPGKPAPAASLKGRQPYVVTTNKLFVPPQAKAGPAATSSTRSRQMELLSEMMAKQKLILLKLNDKSLDDESRKKYKAIAQTLQTAIQGQLAALAGAGKRKRK